LISIRLKNVILSILKKTKKCIFKKFLLIPFDNWDLISFKNRSVEKTKKSDRENHQEKVVILLYD